MIDGFTKAMYDVFSAKLIEHIGFVQQACIKLGVPEEQAGAHDESKWSKEEFHAYAYKFAGPGDDPDSFSLAWLHHIHHNPHHPQHWIIPGGGERGVLRMPDEYCLEMIADWMGASKAYTGAWDMTDWLNKNFKNVKLHPDSCKFVKEILFKLGYGSI